MKNITLLWIILFLMTCGCITTTPPKNLGDYSQENMDKAAILMRSAVFSATVIAIDRNPDLREYAEYAISSIDMLVGEGDFSPDMLKDVLDRHPKTSLRDVILVMNTINSVYELYHIEYIKGRIDSSNDSIRLLQSIKNGLEQGLFLTKAHVTAGILSEEFR